MLQIIILKWKCFLAYFGFLCLVILNWSDIRRKINTSTKPVDKFSEITLVVDGQQISSTSQSIPVRDGLCSNANIRFANNMKLSKKSKALGIIKMARPRPVAGLSDFYQGTVPTYNIIQHLNLFYFFKKKCIMYLKHKIIKSWSWKI